MYSVRVFSCLLLIYYSLQTSPGYYGLLLNNWERAHGTYPVTMATLRLLLNTLLSHDYHMIPEDMVASTVYIMQAVFVSSHNWRYKNQTHRDRFCKILPVIPPNKGHIGTSHLSL